MVRAVACAAVVLGTPCFAETATSAPPACAAPIASTDGWTVAAPDAVGLDPALICSIGSDLAGKAEADAHGVVVVRHGRLVYERYFAGADLRWPETHWGTALTVTSHDADTPHDLQSITKSVVALLVGIAIDRGRIAGIDAPVATLLPQDADLLAGDKARITLRDLLTMRSGLEWPVKPFLDTARRMDDAADAARFVLGYPLIRPPGKAMHYNNGSIEVVGAILHRATGEPLDRFADESLFEPLGISTFEWGRMADGEPGASWGLRLRPRDLAKIGQLVLDHGSWRGRQIVPAAWIEAMTTPKASQDASRYGFLWWIDDAVVKGRTTDVVEGVGWGGQYLYILPAEDLVVVVTAGAYDYAGERDQGLAGETVWTGHVLPALRVP